jgi:hypothetical protein
MRFSLFSLVLRAGLIYDGSRPWKKCLYEHPYIAYTKEAVEWFFGGHPNYTGGLDSWWRQFDTEILRSKGQVGQIDKLLTIPNWFERNFRKIGKKLPFWA